MRILAITAAILAIIAVVVLGRTSQHHKSIHRHLETENVIRVGSGIGSVIADLRENGTEITRTNFQNRYQNAFSLRLSITTDQNGDLLIKDGAGTGGESVWFVATNNPTVRLMQCAYPDLPDGVSLFKNVDFSKPLLDANVPISLRPLPHDFFVASDSMWECYKSNRKEKSNQSADIDHVDREIRFEKGTLWVEDKFRVHERYTSRDAVMQSVVDAARENSSDLRQKAAELLKGESLELRDFEAKVQDEILTLRLLSAVVPGNGDSPAKLTWWPFLAGQKVSFPTGAIGRNESGAEILIFNRDGTSVLWFPDLGMVDNKALAVVDAQKEVADVILSGANLEYSLKLASDNGVVQLAQWDLGAKFPSQPDSAFLLSISRYHPISCNDLGALCNGSVTRDAKPGYYLIHRGDSVPTKASAGQGHKLAQENAGLEKRYPNVTGAFDPAAGYIQGWKETGAVGTGFSGEDIDLKEFYYRNDSMFLYLFFKCKPTIQERYDRLHKTGYLGLLYIDSDSDRSTGATHDDEAGNSAMAGADLKISVPLGYTMTFDHDHGQQTVCSVTYELSRWNPAERDFSVELRKEDSTGLRHLIAHGKDGVEMAIPLRDIGKKKGDKFDFVAIEWANNRPELANRIAIKLQ